jgi:hypothetical protein
VFQPDTLLPAQFFSVLRQKAFVEGEKRLMAAVLADAVDCYMKHAFSTDTRSHNLFVDAKGWIFEDEKGPWFFSFINICDLLGLEPAYIRAGLLKWRERREPAIRPSNAFRRAGRASRASDDGELKRAG